MTKRIIATLLASLMLLGLFAGCSSNASTETTAAATTAAETTAAETTAAETTAAETTAAETTAAETTAAETTAEETTAATTEPIENVTLNLFWAGCGPQKDTDEVLDYINELLQDPMPGTTLNWTILTFSEFVEKYYKALAAGEVMDAAWSGWKFDISKEVNDGNLLALDDYINEYGQDIISYYGEDIINMHYRTDGHLYLIPAYQGLLYGYVQLALRKDVADLFTEDEKNEICSTIMGTDYDPSEEALRTYYDAFESILSRAKENGVLGSGISCAESTIDEGWHYAYYPVANYGYANYGDETFTIENGLTGMPAAVEFEYSARWFSEGYIPEDIATNENYGWDKGEDSWAIATFAGIGYADPEATLSEQAGQEIKLWQIYSPDHLQLGNGTGQVIPFTAEHPELAMQFLNLLYTEEGKFIYRTYVYGLEGKHWEYVSEDDKDTIDLFGGVGEPESDWDYGNKCWTLGTCENIFTTSFASPDVYRNYREKEKSAYISPLIKFNFDPTNVSVEQSQISAVRGEYYAPLRQGILGADGWEAYYNEYSEKLVAAGIDAYLAEVQAQIEEYKTQVNPAW